MCAANFLDDFLDDSVLACRAFMCSTDRLQDWRTSITVLSTSLVCRVKLTERNPGKCRQKVHRIAVILYNSNTVKAKT